VNRSRQAIEGRRAFASRRPAERGSSDGVPFHGVIDGVMARTGDPAGTGGSDLPDLKVAFNAGLREPAASRTPARRAASALLCVPFPDQSTVLTAEVRVPDDGDTLVDFGPFAAGLDPDERIARLLRLHRVLSSTQTTAQAAVRAALSNADALPAALAALDALPPTERRILIARYEGKPEPAAFWGETDEPSD
jgi:hypothetical protein